MGGSVSPHTSDCLYPPPPPHKSAKSLQACSTLCNTMVRNPPCSSEHGISQARILEWVAMPSSRGPSQPRDGTSVSYVSCIDRQALYQLCHLARLEGRRVKFRGFRRPAESSTGTLWSWRDKGTDAAATLQAAKAEPGWSGPLGWWDEERGAWQ